MTRVAVFGASGFVGSTLVERLLMRGGREVRPIVHTSGNAWRLARWGIDLQSVDLLDETAVRQSLRGCTHVVNCSRGGDDVMLRGLETLLRACRGAGVQRLVHLSSVAVYGDPPVAGSETEDAPTRPVRGSYGWVKLQQDNMLRKAASRGLSAIALCPPNISGPNSAYLLAILAALRRGALPLLDAGRRPCMLVDVENLAYAIDLALDGGPADGQRIFVTDAEAASWHQLVEGLIGLPPAGAPAPGDISVGQLTNLLAAARPPRASLRRALKHLVSSELREVLRRDPLLARIDRFGRNLVGKLGTSVEERLRRSLEGPNRAAAARPEPQIDLRLTAQQLRTVVHSPRRAGRLLGYRPPHAFAGSMRAFATWYRETTGLDSRFGALYAKLYS